MAIHDNGLVGFLADRCHHYEIGYHPCIDNNNVSSNAQLCRLGLSSDDCQMQNAGGIILSLHGSATYSPLHFACVKNVK